ncbi:hypothetical protein ITI46_05205 [Streptomyces oryzae]|uniref:Nitrate reductase n=1 Tax=Streptomyces oryzae TaxID=1434886 RepID=A0ABS3X7N1_9ACTN|nr:hypothetical protein [Streptomyces oryzae]MBO8191092.1 hypothetical protein [Streptomyces oryzae]
MSALFTALMYAVPAVVIVVTVYIGYLGARFYIDEVIKSPGDGSSS